MLKFRITTDGTVNHGGGAIDGWEGIMIDDLRVVSAVGTNNMQTSLLANFTDNSTQYLETSTGYPNEWQHVDWEGYNGPWSSFDSFEEVQGLPRVGELITFEGQLRGSAALLTIAMDTVQINHLGLAVPMAWELIWMAYIPITFTHT